MATPIVVSGDDLALPVQLHKNGETFLIAPTAQIHARLVSLDHRTPLSPEVVVADLPGGDWPASRIVVALPGSATSGIDAPGPAHLEIQVADGGKTTWFLPVIVVIGTIP